MYFKALEVASKHRDVSVITQVRGILSQEVLHFVCLEAIMFANSVFVNDGVLTHMLYFPLFTYARFAREIRGLELFNSGNYLFTTDTK